MDTSRMPDVETTNWKAISSLAASYGIQLRSLDEAEAEARAEGERSAAAGLVGLENGKGIGTEADRAGIMNAPGIGLGIGTGTGTGTGNGSGSTELGEAQDLGVGTPFEITARRMPGGRVTYRFKWRGETAQQHSLSVSNDADGDATDSPSRGGLSNSNNKRQFKTLKGSRSIPALLRSVGVSPQQQISSYRSEAQQAESSTRATPSSSSRLLGAVTSPAMARSTSQFEQRQLQQQKQQREREASAASSANLESGDVLGAILGIRQGITASASQDSALSYGRQSPQRAPSILSSKQQHSSKHDRQSLHQLSDGRSVSPFGQPVRTTEAYSSSSSATTVPQLASTSVGSPLFADMSLFEIGLDAKPSVLTKQPHLRQVQSFESADSAATARARDEERATSSDEDIGAVHMGEEAFLRTIFDVVQHAWSPASRVSQRRDSEQIDEEGEGEGDGEVLKDTSRITLPGDDARFSLWATRNSQDDEALAFSGRSGLDSSNRSSQSQSQSQSQPQTPSQSPRDTHAKRWSVRGSFGSGEEVRGSPAAAATSSFQSSSSAGSSSSTSSSSANSSATSATPSSSTSAASSSGSSGDASNNTRKRTNKNASEELAHSMMLFPQEGPFLVAASTAYIIAELTSRIDHKFETDFFYTYRAYTTPSHVLTLLGARLQWAMAPAKTAVDATRRQVVRVRTYAVIKWWLHHFFYIDFVPDRALRRQLVDWLNGLERQSRDPATRHLVHVDTVRSLKKVVRGLKAHYQQSSTDTLLAGSLAEAAAASHDRGYKTNADAARPMGESVDFELAGDAAAANGGDDEDHGAAATVAATANAAAAAAVDSESNSSGQQRQKQRRSGSDGNITTNANNKANASMTQQPPPLPSSHSAFSRVFVNTVGRLSRFKRSLGNTPNGATGARLGNGADGLGSSGGEGSGGSGFDGLEFEATDSGDLLFIRGGLEHFISHFDLGLPPSVTTTPAAMTTPTLPPTLEHDSGDESGAVTPPSVAGDQPEEETTPSLSATSDKQAGSTPASSLDLGNEASQELRKSLLTRDGVQTRFSFGRGDNNLNFTSMDRDALSLEPAAPLAELDSLIVGKAAPNQVDLHHTTSEQTLRSESTAGDRRSRQPPLAVTYRASYRRSGSGSGSSSLGGGSMARYPNIVQIDDVDLSSDEDEGMVRRALRRLPGARDLRMANHVRDLGQRQASFDDSGSVSNFGSVFGGGHRKRSSYASTFSSGDYDLQRQQQQQQQQQQQIPPKIGFVETEMLDPDEHLQHYELVKGFRLDALPDSDDDEPGDVEAALRRLEGFIDKDKQLEKQRRVERIWQQSQERMAQERQQQQQQQQSQAQKQRHTLAPSIMSASREHIAGDGEEDEEEEEQGVGAALPQVQESLQEQEALQEQGEAAPQEQMTTEAKRQEVTFEAQRQATPTKIAMAQGQATRPSKSTTKGRSARTKRPASQGNVLDGPPAPWGQPRTAAAAVGSLPHTASPFAQLGAPIHRSFLLGYRSEVLAQQFTIIEAELFRNVTWQELASDLWRSKTYQQEVLDWEAFHQSRVRAKVLGNSASTEQQSAVEAITARFNLTCNWVASEVVLTQGVSDRAAVLSKLIRIAWKCYQHCNFATLTQIIVGLQSPWVERLRKSWSRVGMQDMRMLRDLKAFINPARNFRHLRQAMRAMAIEGKMEDLVTSAGPPRMRGAAPASSTPSSQASSPAHTRTASHPLHLGGGGKSSSEGAMDGGSLTNEAGDGKKQTRRIHEGACVPFFGLFISDLQATDALPTLLDPSSVAPPAYATASANEPLEILAQPDAFDDLPPLAPAARALRPLVNLYKYRSKAVTVKTVLAFQEKAAGFGQLEADAGVFVKALKIRCLQGEQMTRISHRLEP